jgi:serine/threonine protein kinase
MQGLHLGGQYEVGERLGGGSFSEIYAGIDQNCSGRRICIKFEDMRIAMPQLSNEADIYSRLQGGVGIPKLYWHGEIKGPESQQGRSYLALVIELLGPYPCPVLVLLCLLTSRLARFSGPSLEDLFAYCHRKFDLKTVLMMADQVDDCSSVAFNDPA